MQFVLASTQCRAKGQDPFAGRYTSGKCAVFQLIINSSHSEYIVLPSCIVHQIPQSQARPHHRIVIMEIKRLIYKELAQEISRPFISILVCLSTV